MPSGPYCQFDPQTNRCVRCNLHITKANRPAKNPCRPDRFRVLKTRKPLKTTREKYLPQ